MRVSKITASSTPHPPFKQQNLLTLACSKTSQIEKKNIITQGHVIVERGDGARTWVDRMYMSSHNLGKDKEALLCCSSAKLFCDEIGLTTQRNPVTVQKICSKRGIYRMGNIQ